MAALNLLTFLTVLIVVYCQNRRLAKARASLREFQEHHGEAQPEPNSTPFDR